MLSVLRARARPAVRIPMTATAKARSISSSSKSSSSKSSSFFRDAWERYQTLLVTRPIVTKMVTGGAIGGAGDLNCQLVLERGSHREGVDWKRVGVFTALNGVLVSPVLHGWYIFLNRTAPGPALPALAKRLALDQFGFAPGFLPIFFAVLLTLERKSDEIGDKLRRDWWPTCVANWTVWIPAQLVNFRFVPASLQVLFANVMGLFWNSYLSYVGHAAVEHQHTETETETETETDTETEAVLKH